MEEEAARVRPLNHALIALRNSRDGNCHPRLKLHRVRKTATAARKKSSPIAMFTPNTRRPVELCGMTSPFSAYSVVGAGSPNQVVSEPAQCTRYFIACKVLITNGKLVEAAGVEPASENVTGQENYMLSRVHAPGITLGRSRPALRTDKKRVPLA